MIILTQISFSNNKGMSLPKSLVVLLKQSILCVVIIAFIISISSTGNTRSNYLKNYVISDFGISILLVDANHQFGSSSSEIQSEDECVQGSDEQCVNMETYYNSDESDDAHYHVINDLNDIIDYDDDVILDFDNDGVNKDDSMEDCDDNNENCILWASSNECESNPSYMLQHCQKSCKVCETNVVSHDLDKYGVPQKVGGPTPQLDKSLDLIHKVQSYMDEQIYKYQQYEHIRSSCRNRNRSCIHWASLGECDKNPSYMTLQCAPACLTCHLLDIKNRCPVDPDDSDIFMPGDLNRMFERIVHGSQYDQSKIHVYSRPTHPPNTTTATTLTHESNYIIGPWVITIDDFLTNEECDKMIQLGGLEGYKRSEDVGTIKFDGTYTAVQSSDRTSFNAWCQFACYEDQVAQNIVRKVELLTGVPDRNSEYLQLLRYEEGQFYKQHHDYIEYQKDRPCGPRILTVFFYLSDVEEGGETYFSNLDLKVKPKRGRVLIWPSVTNENPSKIDSRTDHEALSVIKGIKYGANGWLHLRDFKSPHDKGCT